LVERGDKDENKNEDWYKEGIRMRIGVRIGIKRG
jgi:hypothetical protein